MDITKTIEPRSDQQNYEDYLTGPRIVTISEVKRGTAEQPVEIHLEEYPGRPYKPSKSMRRVLVHAWGPKTSEYLGRQLKLFGDPDVKFGGQKVGGIKIAAMSHIEKRFTLSLTVTKGKRAPVTVDVLEHTPTAPAEAPLDLAPMWNALKVAGFEDPATARKTVEGIIGRAISSSADLTAEDMAAVMDELAALASGDAS